MRFKPRFILKLFAIVSGMLFPLASHADYTITASEIKLLPPFCRGLSIGNYEPDARRYATNNLPRGMPHVHHFCHGLKSVVRANKNLGDKAKLISAEGEFDYVLTKTKNNDGRYNRYLAIVSTERAKVLKRLGNTAEAIQGFEQAIKYNPKLPQAYAGLSDLYRDLGMNKESREILERGLKRVPKSKSLQRRLDKR